MLSSVVVKAAAQKPSALVVFLHGLGDSGHGWAPVGEMLRKQLPHVQFVFPNAPEAPVTVNFGMKMPSWYDIKSFGGIDDADKQDEPGLLASVGAVQQLIQHTCDTLQIAPSRVVLGGFSQGGAVSLLSAATARLEQPYAGIVALSSYLPLHQRVPSLLQKGNCGMPVFMGHGTADPVVQFAWGEQSRDELASLGFSNVTFKSYAGMQHASCDQELRDLLAFLQQVVPAEG